MKRTHLRLILSPANWQHLRITHCMHAMRMSGVHRHTHTHTNRLHAHGSCHVWSALRLVCLIENRQQTPGWHTERESRGFGIRGVCNATGVVGDGIFEREWITHAHKPQRTRENAPGSSHVPVPERRIRHKPHSTCESVACKCNTITWLN